MTVSQVSHDAFGRWALMRESLSASELGGSVTCAECGNRNGHNGLFRYGSESDGYGARVNWDSRLFCSVQCYRDYHGF